MNNTDIEVDRLSVDILGISDVQWSNAGKIMVNKNYILFRKPRWITSL